MAAYSLTRTMWMFDELNMARCTRCNRWRPAELFAERATRPTGLDVWCRSCRAEHMAEPSPCGTPGWSRKRAASILSNYRMTPGEWEDMFQRQGSSCYLCGTGTTAKWVVDHDHDCCPGPRSCGACVLGIACHECNTLEASIQRLIARGGGLGLDRVLRRAQGL